MEQISGLEVASTYRSVRKEMEKKLDRRVRGAVIPPVRE